MTPQGELVVAIVRVFLAMSHRVSHWFREATTMHAKAVALLQTDDRRALDCCSKAIIMYTRMNSVLGLASAKEMMGKLKVRRTPRQCKPRHDAHALWGHEAVGGGGVPDECSLAVVVIAPVPVRVKFGGRSVVRAPGLRGSTAAVPELSCWRDGLARCCYVFEVDRRGSGMGCTSSSRLWSYVARANVRTRLPRFSAKGTTGCS